MHASNQVIRTSPAMALVAEKRRGDIERVLASGLAKARSEGVRTGFAWGIEEAAKAVCPCCKREWPRNGDKHISPLGSKITCTAMNIHNIIGDESNGRIGQ